MSTSTLKRYVAGFLFSPDKQEVVLIRKNNPEWQRGLLNGVGGKIEENESSIEAMSREFYEETGLGVFNWKPFVVLHGNGWSVEFYHACSEEYRDVRSKTSEKVEVVPVSNIASMPVIPNLLWLIPMALDPNHHDAKIIATN